MSAPGIGLTILVSGAEIVSANADTTIPQVLPINTFEGDLDPLHNPLNFQQFNLPGTLTGVTFDLNSSFNLAALLLVSAAVTVNGTQGHHERATQRSHSLYSWPSSHNSKRWAFLLWQIQQMRRARRGKGKPGGYLRFKNCGFSDRTIRALLAGGVATPERLPSMTPDQVRLIRGIGPALMKEVERYRAQFWKRPPTRP